MSDDKFLVMENSETESFDNEASGIDAIRTGDTYSLEAELEELSTDDELNPHKENHLEHSEISDRKPLPVILVLEKIESQAPEMVYLGELENGEEDHSLKRHEPEVIELDSEDEIENLEDSEISPNEFSLQFTENELNAATNINHSTSIQKDGTQKLRTKMDELSESEAENIDDLESDQVGGFEELADTNEAAKLSHPSISGIPIFINVRGDQFLLVPFYGKCDYNFEDMISLFTFDEISDCTIKEFFDLLRGNGDLIDAYNFEVDDELCLNVPEMSISITEDNVHTDTLRLNDLVDPFLSLISKENGFPKSTPDKMTLLISMQPRFSTNFRKIVEAVAHGKGYYDIFNAQSHRDIDEDDSSSRKRQRTSP